MGGPVYFLYSQMGFDTVPIGARAAKVEIFCAGAGEIDTFCAGSKEEECMIAGTVESEVCH